jgi:2-methylcitrate dehydratase PrpD
VSLLEDPAMPKEAASVAVRAGGSTLDKYVPHATGSLERPMSDEALERKFRSLAEWGWPQCDTRSFIELAWSLDKLADAGAFARAASPPHQ